MTPFRLIDTHVHLQMSQFADDQEDVIQRAADAGVTRMIEIGLDVATSRTALALAEQYDQMYAVVGVQPNFIENTEIGWLAEIRAMAAHPKVVAIGEIGLDYYWKKVPREMQEQVFREQLALAAELELPVVIHTRDAHQDTIQVLREAASGPPGIIHSFSGNWDFARDCLDLGFWLSFSGPVTFLKAHDLHDVARRAPIDRILIETDSPYLSPHPWRGKRNEPARVRLVAGSIASLRRVPLADIAETTWTNAEQVFGWHH
ncbi:MAG: TatD family hydrolase [Chloroflexaceae bacterium]|nr:TatD family hydrolase [Chloroflexaceae bacterium]